MSEKYNVELPQNNENELTELTADIVSAYVTNHEVKVDDLPELITQVYCTLKSVGHHNSQNEQVLSPAVPVASSITDDFIICLEDGKKFKSLKRHLRTHYNLSPEEYRKKWGLASDYPMVAPNYAAARSKLAKKMGLGLQRSK